MKKIKEIVNMQITCNYSPYRFNENVKLEMTVPSIADLIIEVVGREVFAEKMGYTENIAALLKAQEKIEDSFLLLMNKTTETLGRIEDNVNEYIESIYLEGQEDGREDAYREGYDDAESEFSDQIEELKERLGE